MDSRRSLAVLMFALLAACTGEVGSVDDPDAGMSDCPEQSLLSWENFGDPFMRSWCTGCHSSDLSVALRRNAPDTVNFDTLEGVRQHEERIWHRAANENRTMPPAGGPGTPERALLGEWLACGAPTQAELGW